MSTKTTLSLAAVLALAAILGLPAIGLAVYQIRSAHRSEIELAAAEQDYASKSSRLQTSRTAANAADARVAELQRNVDDARTALAAKPAAPVASTPPANRPPPMETQRADGEKFLAMYGQARTMLTDVGKIQFRRGLAGFYRFAGLTQGQIDELESRTAAYMLENVALTPNSIYPTTNMLPPEQLKQILGDDGFKKWEEYQRVRGAYQFTVMAATNVGYSAPPLSDQQIDQLAQVVAVNNPMWKAGRNVDMGATDWASVNAQAKPLLTPAQYDAMQTTLLQLQFRSAVNQAQRAAGAPGEKKPGG